jgi:peptidoglycan/LPS O-acetylase OafA/YrhL
MGLCLFFALSAYLITDLLLRERDATGIISIKRFYIRRLLRIWPLYFLGLSIALIFEARAHEHHYAALLWFVFFAANIYGCIHGGLPQNPMSPLWSISIEEQFYLVWPWAMRWLSKRALLASALFFIFVANITLFVLGQRHADTDTTVWFNSFAQSEMFAVGIILALAGKPQIRGNAIFGISLAAAGPILWFIACFLFHAKQPAHVRLATSGPALMAGWMLIALGCAAIRRGFSMVGPAHMPDWAVALGKISYGLYVYHMLALQISRQLLLRLGAWGHLHSWLWSSIAFALTVLAARLSYAFYEKPFLLLKKRFEIIHGRGI